MVYRKRGRKIINAVTEVVVDGKARKIAILFAPVPLW